MSTANMLLRLIHKGIAQQCWQTTRYSPPRLESNSASGNPIISVNIIILHTHTFILHSLKCEIQTRCVFHFKTLKRLTDIYETSHGPYTVICHNIRVILKLSPDTKQKNAREKFWRIRNTISTQSRVPSESTAFSNNT